MPLAALMGLGALAGAAPTIISSLSPAAREARRQLRMDVDAMRHGKLGMSAAERAQAGSDINRQIAAQTKGTEDELRRQAAALGVGRSGQQQAAMGDLQAKRMEAAAQGMGKVDAASATLAQTRKQDIMNRLAAQRDRNAANIQAGLSGAMQGVAGGVAGEQFIRGKDLGNLESSLTGLAGIPKK